MVAVTVDTPPVKHGHPYEDSESSRSWGVPVIHGQRVSSQGRMSLFACEAPNNWLSLAMRHLRRF